LETLDASGKRTVGAFNTGRRSFFELSPDRISPTLFISRRLADEKLYRILPGILAPAATARVEIHNEIGFILPGYNCGKPIASSIARTLYIWPIILRAALCRSGTSFRTALIQWVIKK
jgi:hypothetical protein